MRACCLKVTSKEPTDRVACTINDRDLPLFDRSCLSLELSAGGHLSDVVWSFSVVPRYMTAD